MNVLQQIARSLVADRAARLLAKASAAPNGPWDMAGKLLADAIATCQKFPDHFGLTFELARACEKVASTVPWDQRAEWVERAVQYYERCVELARTGMLDGANDVPEVAVIAWQANLALDRRALLAASLHAGLILSAEFRVRDPDRAVAYLEPVIGELPGHHPARYYLGEAYLFGGRFDEAERVWTEALARAPDDPTLRAVLRNLPTDRVHHAVKIRDWPRVLREIERLPGDAMPTAERLTIEGDARLALGDRTGAVRCWQAALQADRLAVGVRMRLRRHLAPRR